MPRVPKVREVLADLQRDGWYLVKSKGGHRQLKHPVKTGRVTLSGNPGDDVYEKTLRSIYRQAGLK